MNFKPQIFKRGLLSYALFLIVLFGNLWLWRIIEKNSLIGSAVVLSSFFLYRSVKRQKLEKLLIVFLLILSIYQVKTTRIVSLTYLNEQEKIVQLRRLNEYPPIKIVFMDKTVWIPLAHWLEERPEVLSLYRIQANLSDVLNPNLYFFANHPNERVGIKEDEMFPYLLLPFFVIGFLSINLRKNLAAFTVSLFAPILLIALIGSQFAVEPILIFPFFVLCITKGIEYIKDKVAKLNFPGLSRSLALLFVVFYIIIFLQTYLYNRF